MSSQFRPPLPHPAYEDTRTVPSIDIYGSTKESLSDGQCNLGTWDGRNSSVFNDTRLSSNAPLFEQETSQHRREDHTHQGSQATGLHINAHNGYIHVPGVGQGVNKQAQALTPLFSYLLLYVITSLSLFLALIFPHPAAWKTSIFAILSTVLFLFSSPVTIKMLFFLMIAPWHTLWLMIIERKRSHTTLFKPLVSVLIPAWNEELGLISTIKTVLASTYRNFEIIVVNDGSTDNSDTAMKQFLAKYEAAMNGVSGAIPIVYHYQQNAGKATALNTGISLSHGEIMICIDADCVLDKDCISTFVNAMRDPSVMACCGNVKVGNPGSVLSLIQLFEYAASFYARQADALLGTLYVISGAAGAYRRTIFDKVGTYGTALRGGGEDVDLSIRVQQAGYKIAYAQNAIVYTEVPITFRALLKQRKRWTFSRFVTFKRYKSMVFSLDSKHNKVLTWLVMPLIIFNDWLYIVKMILKFGLYVIAIATGSYQVLTMLILLSMVITAIPLFQDKSYRMYLFLTPLSWLLSFISAYVEMYASASSIRSLLSNREVTWGEQQRRGAVNLDRRS